MTNAAGTKQYPTVTLAGDTEMNCEFDAAMAAAEERCREGQHDFNGRLHSEEYNSTCVLCGAPDPNYEPPKYSEALRAMVIRLHASRRDEDALECIVHHKGCGESFAKTILEHILEEHYSDMYEKEHAAEPDEYWLEHSMGLHAPMPPTGPTDEDDDLGWSEFTYRNHNTEEAI